MARARLAWVRLFPSDILSSTTWTCADAAARGIYASLLFRQATLGGDPLPADPAMLARLAGVTLAEFELAWPQIEAAFAKVPGVRGATAAYENRRMASEVEHAERISRAGKTAAAKRWPKRTYATGMRSHKRSDSSRICKPEEDLETCGLSSSRRAGEPPSSAPLAQTATGKKQSDGEKTPDPRSLESEDVETQGVSTDVGEAAEIVDALARSVGGSPGRDWRERNARQAALLVARGGLQDARDPDSAPCGPQTPASILGLLAWLAGQPEVSGSGEAFSWRPQVRSIATLRRKWPKIAQAARAAIEASPPRERRRALAELAWAELRALLRRGGYDSTRTEHLASAAGNATVAILGGLREVRGMIERDEPDAHRRFVAICAEPSTSTTSRQPEPAR